MIYSLFHVLFVDLCAGRLSHFTDSPTAGSERLCCCGRKYTCVRKNQQNVPEEEWTPGGATERGSADSSFQQLKRCLAGSEPYLLFVFVNSYSSERMGCLIYFRVVRSVWTCLLRSSTVTKSSVVRRHAEVWFNISQVRVLLDAHRLERDDSQLQ